MPLTFRKNTSNTDETGGGGSDVGVGGDMGGGSDVGVGSDMGGGGDAGKWESVFEVPKIGCALWIRDLELSQSDIDSLWSAPLVEKPETMVMGRPCKMRRNIGFFSDSSAGYQYTGQTAEAQPLSPAMKRLLDRVNKLCGLDSGDGSDGNGSDGNGSDGNGSDGNGSDGNGSDGNGFNGLLFNLYVDGNDCIGAHRDNESNLSSVGVVALSLGAGRKFRVRSYPQGEILYDHVTGGSSAHVGSKHRVRVGELMWMKGDNFHKKLTHEVPVEKRVKDPRLSITFRRHLS